MSKSTKRYFTLLVLISMLVPVMAQRERICFDGGWRFAFGNASDPVKDFGCGTEYFNYLTKANSIHNEGPYALKFVEDSTQWRSVSLPHDFVVDLPFAKEASHSHGYKTVGWLYPETSVAWYRKTFRLSESDRGKHVRLQFDGIFRDAQVWVNGILVGREPSGYTAHDYDITPYLLFGDGKEALNLVCVRADASLEEGWFYEGGGIYRHTWLVKCNPLHVATDGTFVYTTFNSDYSQAHITIETEVANEFAVPHGTTVDSPVTLRHTLIDADGQRVSTTTTGIAHLRPCQSGTATATMIVTNPHLWSTDTPYLYNVLTEVIAGGKVVDTYTTRTGLREVRWDKDQGLLLNGKSVKLRGFNMHQDHAGVGAAIPDGLQRYRIERLKWMGANAYRASHNPMTKEALDACDELGMLVYAENRLLGVNPFEMHVAKSMIRRDRNHPSVILWGIGNEEWGLEWDDRSIDIARQMTAMFHLLDPTRKVSAATSSGPKIVMGTDVAGYNYILQNPVDEHRRSYPERIAVGSEETTGCGTRGVYFHDMPGDAPDYSTDQYTMYEQRNKHGRMPALNRCADKDSCMNRIERGWRFYAERPWLAGLFYWTGFDYRGESNPIVWPATGSSFGVLDYCGFPKDEAYYLRSWWRPEEPTLHILPHWNLQGHEGETVSVWAYSNCDEVELIVNGRRLGRRQMPHYGHLEWETVYQPGYVRAIGYKNGHRVCDERVETTGEAAQVRTQCWQHGDITVIDIAVHDSKGRFVPTACVPLCVTLNGCASPLCGQAYDGATVLGWGNGDSAFKYNEHDLTTLHTFNGRAQLIIQSSAAPDVSIGIGNRE